MKNPMASVLAPGRKRLTDELMRGSGSCIDDIRDNGARYLDRNARANAAPPLSETYAAIPVDPLTGAWPL